VPVKEAAQSGSAQPADLVRVGVAGGQEPQRRLVGQVGVQGGQPPGAEQLQQRVQAGQGGGAALDQGGAQLGRASQRRGGTQAVLGVQAVWVQQRQPGEQARVEPVGLGVLVVLGAQVG
jgi:hypothetical protein